MKCACPEVATKRFRWTVAVQSPSGTPDAHGHVDLTDAANWTALGNIRVNFITQGAREKFTYDQTHAEVTHMLETRSTTLSRSIQPDDRVIFDGRTFNVTGVYDVNEERQVVHIMLTEKV